MSEVMPIPAQPEHGAKRTPTVYFIDDSATMREVIKIAFRRENINVVTCSDAASALAQFEMNPPDAVITDVIMPDQDGYSVCTQIRRDPEYGSIPVVLMSGVVNKTVADKAVAVGADELIRKPFQPQELISRVKALLSPKLTSPPSERPSQPHSLTSLFAPPAPAQLPTPSTVPMPMPAFAPPSLPSASVAESAWPRALAEAFSPRPQSPAMSSQQNAAASTPAPQHLAARPPSQIDAQKLRGEIARLELLVKKLQTELQIERQYSQALELQIHTLTHSE
jgi:CheY-like chemotaxis protein